MRKLDYFLAGLLTFDCNVRLIKGPSFLLALRFLLD
jgi:hypothetical protein